MSDQKDDKSAYNFYKKVEMLEDYPDRKVVGITTADDGPILFLDVDEFLRRLENVKAFLIHQFPKVDEKRLLIKIDEKGWNFYWYNPPPEGPHQ